MKNVLGILIAGLLLFTVTVSYAAQNANYQLVKDSAAVAGTAVIYTDAIMVGGYSDLAFLLTVHGSTVTSNVKLEVQISDSNSAVASVVNTTGDTSVDPNYDTVSSTNNYQTEWTDLQSGGLLVSAQAQGKIADGISLPVTRWCRFKITGNATNEVTPGLTRVSLTIGRYGERP